MARHPLARATFSLLLGLTEAETVFRPNCTLPTESVNVVLSPSTRSTLDILFGCLATLFLCTWTSQHLNLPPRGIDGEGFAEKCWKKFWRKLKWMVLAIVLPEYFVGKALADFIAAYRSSRCPTMQEHAKESGTTWTITHAFFANMGGVVLKLPKDTPSSSHRPSGVDAAGQSEVTTASTTAEEGDVAPSPSSSGYMDRFLSYLLCGPDSYWKREHDAWLGDRQMLAEDRVPEPRFPAAVNSAHLCTLISKGFVKRLPDISEKEIEDKSDEDFLVKLIALWQLLWLFVQLVARKVSGLPCSQLEVAILGFAICMFVSYLYQFKKPKDVAEPITIYSDRLPNASDKEILLVLNQFGFLKSTYGTNWYTPVSMTVPNDQINPDSLLVKWEYGDFRQGIVDGILFTGEDLGFILGGVIFGAVHSIAWNFEFPTRVEQQLWRAASLFTTVAIPMEYFANMLLSLLSQRLLTMRNSRRPLGRRLVTLLVWPCRNLFKQFLYGLYTLSRLFIIVEVFRSLVHLPPRAFVSTWQLPHGGAS